MSIALFDTHTHFDVPDFDSDREQLAYAAKAAGVEHLVLIGFVQSRFQDLIATQQFLNQLEQVPQSHLAPGLHPFYIEQHQNQHLQDLEQFLQQQHCIAVVAYFAFSINYFVFLIITNDSIKQFILKRVCVFLKKFYTHILC